MEPTKQLEIVKGLHDMGLPMDDDWLYQTFTIAKPKDYEQLKVEAQANKEAVRKALNDSGDEDGKLPLNTNKKAFNSRAIESHGTGSNDREQPRVNKVKNRLSRFFGIAPDSGADTDF